jgi:hypothetical protein
MREHDPTPRGEPATLAIAMPADAEPAGDLVGRPYASADPAAGNTP